VTIPYRGNTGLGSYIVTSASYQRIPVFETDKMATLLLDVLFRYRDQGICFLHEFVIMRDHVHLLLTPTDTVERTMQLIKSGFSYRAKKELGYSGEIWETRFYDRRIRDWKEYCQFREYIRWNPLKARRSETPEGYWYSSAAEGFMLDTVTQWLESAS
jgi:putative transposase